MSIRKGYTRSVTRTVRIDEDVQDMLEELAERENVSVNALVNVALRKHVVWNAPLEKFDAVATPMQLLVRLIEHLSDNDAKDLGRTVGKNIAKEFMLLAFNSSDLGFVLRYFQLHSQQQKSFHYEHKEDGGVHTIIFRHAMGMKWSLYYSELAKSLFRELNIEPTVELLQNQVTVRFRTEEQNGSSPLFPRFWKRSSSQPSNRDD